MLQMGIRKLILKKVGVKHNTNRENKVITKGKKFYFPF